MKKRKKSTPLSKAIFTREQTYSMEQIEIQFTENLPRPKTPEEILIRKEDETRKVIMKFFDMFLDIFLTLSTPKPRSHRKGRKKGK